MAGPACSSPNNSLPCNSCADPTCLDSEGKKKGKLCACNESRIYDDLIVRITLQGIKPGSGNVILADSEDVVIPSVTRNNEGKFVDFTWRSYCRSLGSTSCEGIPFDSNSRLSIVLDKNRNHSVDRGEPAIEVQMSVVNPGSIMNVYGEPVLEGVGNFIPYPGDGKVFIEDLSVTPGFPVLGYGSAAQAVRVFISDKSMEEARPYAGLIHEDLQVKDDSSGLITSVVGGLDNNKKYFFRIGLLDEAQNIVQMFPNADACADKSKPCAFSATPASVKGQVIVLSELERAITANHIAKVRTLIPLLKDIDQPFNDIRETPLTLSALNARYEITKLLLDNGAKVNQQTTNGYTALMFAALSRVDMHTDSALKTAKVLLAAGADKAVRNRDGKTARDFAIETGHTDIAKLLY